MTPGPSTTHDADAYVSSELFHFTGYRHPSDDEVNYETLRSILLTRIVGNNPGAGGCGDIGYRYERSGSLVKSNMITPGMTCFADIPMRALRVHCVKYGKCGVSIHREHLVRYGARPVIYFPHHPEDFAGVVGTTVLQDIEEAFRSMQDQLHIAGRKMTERRMGSPAKSLEEAVSTLSNIFAFEFLAFLKPFRATLATDAAENYYMEREWRKIGNIKFKQEHVRSIIVPASFISRAEKEYSMYRGRIKAFESVVAGAAI